MRAQVEVSNRQARIYKLTGGAGVILAILTFLAQNWGHIRW